MKKVAKKKNLKVDVDQIKSDWEAYLEIEAEERKQHEGKHYKRGGSSRSHKI